MIVFKSMASAHDSCSYHQVKTLIGFWCRWDLNVMMVTLTIRSRHQLVFSVDGILNSGPLLDDKRLYQLS